MQAFEIVVVDEPATLADVGAIRRRVPAVFLREDLRQLSFSEEELRRRTTGVLASVFPSAWRSAEPDAAASRPGIRRDVMAGCPALLVVLYDPAMRVPASEGDVLDILGRHCVMQHMWLAADGLGIGLQILSALSADAIDPELRRILAFPPELKVAFACRIGYPATPAQPYPRVRREIADLAHRNRYGSRIALGTGG